MPNITTMQELQPGPLHYSMIEKSCADTPEARAMALRNHALDLAITFDQPIVIPAEAVAQPLMRGEYVPLWNNVLKGVIHEVVAEDDGTAIIRKKEVSTSGEDPFEARRLRLRESAEKRAAALASVLERATALALVQ
jgi:hypothetical protein